MPGSCRARSRITACGRCSPTPTSPAAPGGRGRAPAFPGRLAAASISTAGPQPQGLGGRGTVDLRNADVYELPVMIAMLKILSIRPPDQKAFSKSDADFRIQGEHIYFDKIDFTGDAISLLGKGEMNFQSETCTSRSRRSWAAASWASRLAQPVHRRQPTIDADPRGRHVAESRHAQGGLPRRRPGPATVAERLAREYQG